MAQSNPQASKYIEIADSTTMAEAKGVLQQCFNTPSQVLRAHYNDHRELMLRAERCNARVVAVAMVSLHEDFFNVPYFATAPAFRGLYLGKVLAEVICLLPVCWGCTRVLVPVMQAGGRPSPGGAPAGSRNSP